LLPQQTAAGMAAIAAARWCDGRVAIPFRRAGEQSLGLIKE
jgi:hypothetical protein